MIARLKRLVPQSWLKPYHYFLARASSWYYGHPSRKLVVIGVTGTNGKTTTSYFLAKALEASGQKTGLTSTAMLKVGEREWINDTKMTMPGRFFLQRMLRQMVDAGCAYAVIETSSQGLIQSRQVGIAYDVAVFTNLTPEHIEAHGGFENYKAAKRILFEYLAKLPPKTIGGALIPRVAVLNADDAHAAYYAATPGLQNIQWYGIDHVQGMQATNLEVQGQAARFVVDHLPISLSLPGRYNVENALGALAVTRIFNIPLSAAIERLQAIERVPGRFERIQAGQPWTVIVDYAPEPESLRRLYEVLSSVPRQRLIHVFGSCGGGRDRARQPILGQMVGKEANIAIVTNEDPYDDPPEEIIQRVADGARSVGKKDGETLFCIQDRREAIQYAMQLARPGDVVLMTGKGCESWICLADGKKMPWNEAEVAREAIQRVLKKNS